MSTAARPQRVGALRPSALIHTFGVGATVELPRLSVLVMGLDEWRREGATVIEEPRLLRAIRQEPGLHGVERLLAPPIPDNDGPAALTGLDASRSIGVPVGVFPRWLVCPVCRRLAPIEGGQFELKINPFRPERSQYVHKNCQKGRGAPPSAVPARFVVACEDGHMDDFPWAAFVHRVATDADVTCHWRLRLNEFGASGEAADVFVKCEVCDAQRPMANAFGEAAVEDDDTPQPLDCTGAHPHLRTRGSCTLTARAILLGASNSWFSVTRSALSLPQHEDPLLQQVAAGWGMLVLVTSADVLTAFRAAGNLGGFEQYPDEVLLAAIAQHRDGGSLLEPGDLRVREWELLTAEHPPQSPDFQARATTVPPDLGELVERVVLVERLREVQALIGFTRVAPPGGDGEDERWTQLGRKLPEWLPAAEVHGEGIFIQLREDRLTAWRESVRDREQQLMDVHVAWCERRGIENPREQFPGMRAILVHSFSHALMRRMAVDSGYSQSAIRERLYVVGAEHEGGPMAGLLLYTAAPGSEGTLGGLVTLGDPGRLGPLIQGALRDAALCDSDPLCAEMLSDDGGLTLHGAACYACMFAPETSCERGNRYLDRGVLVPLITGLDAGFFGQSDG